MIVLFLYFLCFAFKYNIYIFISVFVLSGLLNPDNGTHKTIQEIKENIYGLFRFWDHLMVPYFTATLYKDITSLFYYY